MVKLPPNPKNVPWTRALRFFAYHLEIKKKNRNFQPKHGYLIEERSMDYVFKHFHQSGTKMTEVLQLIPRSYRSSDVTFTK